MTLHADFNSSHADIPVVELRAAASRPEVVAVMRDLYARADEHIAAQLPTCWNKGECCRFGAYGHRLYVTALEAVYYIAMEAADSDSMACGSSSALPVVKDKDDVCPHAREGKCHARQRRPLGCRVFYCDPAAQHWQGPLTESFLGELRRLHDELGVPYFYADWMAVLTALRAEPA